MADLFELAKAGHGQVVCITGAAGVGKSRLVRELRREIAAGSDQVRWLIGHCSAATQSIVLKPVIEQLRQVFDIEDGDARADIVARVEALTEPVADMAGHAPYILPLLVDWSDETIASIDAALRRARTFDALRAVTIAAVERPTVLVFEDLQWIDRSTEAFLSSAIDAVANAPVLVIATHRSGYTPPFADSAALTTLTLDGLSPADSAALAGHVLGTMQLPPRLTAELTRNAAGMPLWIEELTRAFLAGVGEPEMPATLEAVVAARLERLGEGARWIMQLCAVVGARTTRRLLERMAERPSQLDGWLAELERQDMLRSEASAPPVYAVKHEVIAGVAYHSLLPDRRVELHRAAAAALEELAGDREDEHYAELSRHWECAEHWVKVMHYGELAGDQAAQIDANAEARELYARALRAAQRLRQPPDPERLVALLTKSAHVAGALGAHEEAINHCTRALAVAREIGDRRAELDVLAGLGEVYDRCHRPEEAHAYRDQALAMAEELDDRALQAACLASRATSIATWQGPTAEARRAARSALELAEQVNDPPLRARALVVLGSVLQWRADFDGCQQYLQEGAALAERIHRGGLLGQALFHLGHAFRSRGRYQQALRWYADGHDHAEHVNDKFWIARAPGIAASVYLDLYDADTAIRLCLESDELAQRLLPGMAEPRGHCLVTLALAHLRRGAQAPAEAFLRRASDLLEKNGSARWRSNVPLLRARAEVALAGGRLDEAWDYATQSRQLATQADARKHVAHAQLILGEIAAAQDRLPDAVQLLRGAVSLAEHIHAARPLWLSGSALGQILAHMEQDREAEAYLTQAAQIIETIAAELGDPALRASFLAADTVAEVYQRLGHRPLPAVGRAAS